VVEHPVEVEVVTELYGAQPVHLVSEGPSAQEVGSTSLHLASAGAAECEPQAAVLDEPVDFVEQRRDLLDLVDDDLRIGRGPHGLELLPQILGMREVSAELLRPEKIDPRHIRIALPEERRLAGLARAPQEEALGPRCRKGEGSLEHALQSIMMI
jgi:hypothetical protein